MNTPEIEYGQVVGTIGWAFEVAEQEDREMEHNSEIYTVNRHGDLTDEFDYSVADVNKNTINGWTRYKTDKDKLMTKIDKAADCGKIDVETVEEFLEYYEVSKK